MDERMMKYARRGSVVHILPINLYVATFGLLCTLCTGQRGFNSLIGEQRKKNIRLSAQTLLDSQTML